MVALKSFPPPPRPPASTGGVPGVVAKREEEREGGGQERGKEVREGGRGESGERLDGTKEGRGGRNKRGGGGRDWRKGQGGGKRRQKQVKVEVCQVPIHLWTHLSQGRPQALDKSLQLCVHRPTSLPPNPQPPHTQRCYTTLSPTLPLVPSRI